MALRVLQAGAHWYSDGAFRVAAFEFEQLYSIHILCKGRSYPCIYALMADRSAIAYRRLFELVRGLASSTTLQSIDADFELVSMNALRLVFPSAEVKGC